MQLEGMLEATYSKALYLEMVLSIEGIIRGGWGIICGPVFDH